MKNAVARVLTLAALLNGGLACAVAQQPATLPDNYIRVSAPNAQKLALNTIARHSEIVKIGIHATPKGVGANAIIAADAPVKIGKKSSDKDCRSWLRVSPPLSQLRRITSSTSSFR